MPTADEQRREQHMLEEWGWDSANAASIAALPYIVDSGDVVGRLDQANRAIELLTELLVNAWVSRGAERAAA